MVTGDLEDPGIQIVKSTTVTLFRQVIHLETQDRFAAVIEGMVKLMRLGKFTGHIRIQLNQGGIKKIETEEETKLTP